MYTLIIIAAILLLLTAAYLYAIRPETDASRQHMLAPFERTYIAHRGYFDTALNYPENSLPAFSRAIHAGYGIELDVQLTRDGQLVVFHDTSLKRMCGISKKVTDCTWEELKDCRLAKTSYGIPLLSQVLSLVSSKVPLIIEIKPEGPCLETARQLSLLMKDYNGAWCIQSFHPMVLRWYKKHQPEVLRGLLSTHFRKNKLQKNPLINFILTNLLLNRYCRPDFLSYNHRYADTFSYRLCRRLYPVTQAAWTIRSQKELEDCRHDFSIFIFDSFKPEA